MGRVMGLYAQLKALAAFAEPSMLESGEILLAWTEKEPRLKRYDHYFDNLLRQKKHSRSAEVEEILGMIEEPFSQTYRTALELTNLEMRFPDAVDSQGQHHTVAQTTLSPTGIQSPDREQRRTSWENYCDTYLSLKNTLASNYIASVKQELFLARARGYKSVLEAKLAPHHMPVEVFYNLLDTFKANLNTWHRYWEIRRRILSVDKLHPYDIWAPIVQNQPVVPYREAIDMICASLAPMGEAYVAVLRRGCLEDGWVDYAPNIGKAKGASCGPGYDTPPFICISYDDTLDAMSALAHELGHAMHIYLMDAYQPHIYNSYFGTSMSVAETVSILHQVLLHAYLLRTRADDPVFQMVLINDALFTYHRYLFITPTLARFELDVHTRAQQGKPLTAEILNDLMAELYAEGYGAAMCDDRKRTAITWAQFMHLYNPFYTSQYSIGISAAHTLAGEIMAGSSRAVENYLSFLKAGTSLYPMDLFDLIGVDIAKPDPIEKAFGILADLVDRLEELASLM
jgi:oligoendopeptidase F